MQCLDLQKTIAYVIVHNRHWNLERWLEAWQHSEQHCIPLTVINTESSVRTSLKLDKICKQYGIPRTEISNAGLDIGAFREAVRNRIISLPTERHNWNCMLWFTDDTVPLCRDFVTCYLNTISEPGIGLCGCHVSDEYKLHVRTNGIAIRREVADQIVFPEGAITKTQCYEFEHRINTLTDQVAVLGWQHKQIAEQSYDVMWDIGHYIHLNLWERFFVEFPTCRQFGMRT